MTIMPTVDGRFPNQLRFDRIERRALHWRLGSAPLNLSLLFSVMHPTASPEEEALLRRLYLVRMLEREASGETGSTIA